MQNTDIDQRIDEQRAEVKRLEAERNRLHLEAHEARERIKDPLRREFEEVVRYARAQGHAWVEKDAFGLVPPKDAAERDGALVDYLAELFSHFDYADLRLYAGPGGHASAVDGELSAARKELRRLREERKAAERGRGFDGPTTVVNRRHEGSRYDVYIGRGPDGTVPRYGRGMWGTPFVVGEDGTREECVEKYERWLFTERSDLLALIPTEIKGRRLGCTCAPLPCHGDILARLADEGE